MKCFRKGVRLPATIFPERGRWQEMRCAAIPVSGQCLDGQGAQVAQVVGRAAYALASLQVEGDEEQCARVAQADAPDVGVQTEEFVTKGVTQGACVRRAAVTAALRSVEPQGIGVEYRRCARFVGRRSVAAKRCSVGKFVML